MPVSPTLRAELTINFTSYLGTSLLVYDAYQECVEIVPCASHTWAGSTPNSM